METISFEDFKKLDIRIGRITSAERVEGSDKLLRLEVDFGEEKRQILAGIGKIYAPEELLGKKCPFAYNLAPKVLMGLESQGMILCSSNESGPVLLHPDRDIPAGSQIK